MALDNQTLAALINDNEEALAAKQIGNDSGCAEILNRKTERGWVSIVDLEQYCLLNGISPKVYAGTLLDPNESEQNAQVFGVCYTANRYLTSTKYQNIDLDLPGVQFLFNALVAFGMVTEQQKNEIMAMAEGKWSVVEKAAGRPGVFVSPDQITGVTI